VDDRDAVGLTHEKVVWRSGGAATRTTTLDEALRLARERRYDLALVRQSLQGRAGTVAALALPELQPRLRVVLYDGRPDARVGLLADRLGRSLTVLAEERLAAWIETSLPLLARMSRDERRVGRATRRAARKLGEPGTSLLPVNLHEVLAMFEEALVRAALEAEPTQRRAARLLGLSESSLRTRMAKLGLRTSR